MSDRNDSFPGTFTGSPENRLYPSSKNFLAIREVMRPDDRFPAHSHEAAQLACAPGGGMLVRIAGKQWRVNGDQFVWVPPFAEHEVTMMGAVETLNLYLGPEFVPRGDRWKQPLVLPVEPLAGAIMRHLCTADPSREQIAMSIALLHDLLAHTAESHEALPMPRDSRAEKVANAILEEPGRDRSVADWGMDAGLSARTLLRLFRAETGLTFAQWRTRARVYAAERLLEQGAAVHTVAELVGFATATGFIRAFRDVFGVTPAVYTRRQKSVR